MEVLTTPHHCMAQQIKVVVIKASRHHAGEQVRKPLQQLPVDPV